MTGSRRKTILLAFAAILVVAFAFRFLSASRLSREARQNFEWFSTLGFPDVKGLPYVRISSPDWDFMHGNSNHSLAEGAFLLVTNSNTFTVFSAYSRSRTFTNSPPGTPKDERTAFEPMDLKSEAEWLLATLRKPPGEEHPFAYITSGISDRDKTFIFAWYCWRQGLDSLALHLYEQAKGMPPYREGKPRRTSPVKAAKQWLRQSYATVKLWFSKNSDPDKHMSFRESLEKDFAEDMMARAMANFRQASTSRTELLREFERYVINFPNSEQRTNAVEIARRLKLMVAEDQSHPIISAEDLAKLPAEERIRELIFQLRDDLPTWYWRTDFEVGPEAQKTASFQLFQLGPAAVPQLIEAIDSDVFTRSVFYPRHRNMANYSVEMIGTVGESARVNLERISGRQFLAQTFFSTNDATSAVREAAQKWWAEFQTKGERQMLIEGVSAGGVAAPQQARMLAKKYPADLSPPLIAGIRATTPINIREQLIPLFVKPLDAAALNFLTNELHTNSELECRITVAMTLRDTPARGDVITAMIQEWEKAIKTADKDDDDAKSVARFLGGCNSPEAIAALGKDLQARPPTLRFAVVQVVGDTNYSYTTEETNSPSPATLAAIEQLLAGALADTWEPADEILSLNNDVDGPGVRIADAAVHYLSQRWPDRYKSDLLQTSRNRERQRIECLNVWRRAHQLAELPNPPFPVVKVAPADLNNIVSLEWSADSVKPPKPFETRLSKLNGKRLRVNDLVDLFLAFARHPEPGTGGLDILAERDDDLTGIRLVATLLPSGSRDPNDGMRRTEYVWIGKDDVAQDDPQWSQTGFVDSDDWYGLEDALVKALAAPADVRLKIHIRLLTDLQ